MLLRIMGSFLICCSALYGTAQINIQWEARLDGTGSFTDKAVDLELDAAGNTYVTGTSYSGSSFDLVTVKYDSDGGELWRSTYGGSGIDEAHAITLDSDNDVIITGSRFISGTDWDIVTIKYDGATGAEEWAVIHGGSSFFDYGADITVDGSDNVIVTGSRSFAADDVDVIVIKYDTDGAELWTDFFGGTGSDEGVVVKTDASDNIYVGGNYEFSAGSTYFDFLLVKYTPGGATTYAVTEDSGFGNLDRPTTMTIDGSGDVILVGSGFTDILNEEDYLTMKFDGTTGALDWKELYAGNSEALDVINAVVTDAAGNVYVTGKSKSIETSEDYYTIAYNSSGTELWADRYTTEGLEYDEGTDIRISDSETYIYVTGFSFYASTNNDFTTIKYDAATGDIEWLTIFDGPSSNSDQALRMQLDPTENIFITGNSHGGLSNLDYSTIKYCQLTTAASPDTSVCEGGSVDLTATGGDDVTWEVLSGDAGSLSCSLCETVTVTPSETTIYIVHSTSLSGCVDYDTVEVVVNENPVPVIYNDTPLEFCDGGSVTLYTDTYDEYDWSTGGVDSFIVVLTADTYMLTVTDSNGCMGSASADVTIYALPDVDVGDDISICPEGSADLTATGATSYLWDADPTLSTVVGATTTATPTVDTEYYVTGTDDNGCQNRDSLFVLIYDLPSVSAGPDGNVCVGDSVQLDATGATTYMWLSEPSLSALDIPDPWASPESITEYFVIGTDDNGCTNIDSVIVSTTSLPMIDAGEDTSVCIGGSVQLFASGGLPDMYVWEDDGTLTATDIFNPFAMPTTGTDYIVEGTDINGCSNTDTVFVLVYDLPMVDAGLDENVCIGDSVQLEATGAEDYVWDSDPTLSALDIPDPWSHPVTTKTYTVTGTDANGCVNEDEVTVNVVPLPDISAGADVTICVGDSTQLDASGGMIYIWDFDPTLSNFVIGDPWAKPTVTTTYTVEGTDGFGCSNTDEVTVTVNPLPEPPVITKEGIYIISSYEEGNQWYHEGSELTGETNDTLNYVEIGMNGEYWVVYTDENGCSVESNRIDNPIIIVDVGIDEEEVFDVKLYPNPTYSDLFLEIDTELDFVQIITMDGKVLTRYANLSPGIQTLDFDMLPSGTYLVQMIKESQIVTKRVVKQ